jgi:CelD/BcsL family acetyltransferase involved in cellulose biosynthesis
MKVIIIDDLSRIRELKKTWNDIYAADAAATVFESWAWISGWLESTPRKWLVLGVQRQARLQQAQATQAANGSTDIANEPYVAFIAFSARKKESKTILAMGGSPHADHTGFVCLPEYVEEAIPALAVFIREQLNWDTLQLLNVNIADPRLDLFLNRLSSKRISIQEGKGTSCPYIPLPENWAQYFNTVLGTSTRKNLRNALNRARRLDGFHVTQIQSGNAESHIETLLSLWQSRWGLKSDDLYMDLRLEDVLNIKRSFLRSCFEANRLWLNILWDGETPIAAGAVLLDTSKNHFCVHKIAANYQYAQLSPGKIWCLYAIKYAIENGYRICDFGRGTEQYKFSLGSEEEFNRNVVIVRMGTVKKLLMSLRSQLQVRTRLKRLIGHSLAPAGS